MAIAAAMVYACAFPARAAEQPRNFLWKIARPGGAAAALDLARVLPDPDGGAAICL